MAGGDVEKDEFIGPIGVVARRHLDGVSGVRDFDELDALNDAPFVDVETGNDSFRENHIILHPRKASGKTNAADG